MESVIIVEKLSKSYGSCVAVDTISFAVERGTVFGLLGANGAGKSSMIECITGTKKPDDGSVSILGMDPVRSRKQLFERVGVQFQETGYQEQIKVNELCEEISSLYQEPADYHDLLSKFGIADKGSSFVKELSGGQRQRLFIVLALTLSLRSFSWMN
ncbi:ATP-binding cassette domain-containing protein [Gracilibacillus sp. Marseille-QA3620]